jgi:hypothetical protein
MARSLGVVMDDPENAAESVKTALTVQANPAGELMPGVGPESGGSGVFPRFRGGAKARIWANARFFRGSFQLGRDGNPALDGGARLDHCAPP